MRDRDQRTERRNISVLATIVLLLGALTTMGMAHDRGAARGQPDGQHCPEHQENPKVEAEGDPAQADETVTVDGEEVRVVIDGSEVEFFDAQGDPMTVEFCMKAATQNSGRQVGDSGEVDWENRGGQTPDISYVVVYGTEDTTTEGCDVDDLELQPSDGVNRTGTPHTMVATVTDAAGEPCEGAGVRFEVDDAGDPEPTEGSDTTDEFGEAYFTFTNSEEAVNIITACTNDDGSLPDDCADADERDTAEKTWDPDGCPGPGPNGSLELTPEDDTNPVGTEHEVTAKVEDADDDACQGAQVRFEVDDAGDPAPTHGHDITGRRGRADFTFTNSEAVTNTITACTNDDGSLPEDCENADHVDTATKTWEDGGNGGCPGGDGNLDLTPETATNEVGTDHDMTATVTDGEGQPCEGAGVRFEVDEAGMPAPSEGSDTTDADGEADFTFTNSEEATNTITACTNDDGSLPEDCENADHVDTATKTWQDGTPPPTAFCRSRVVSLNDAALVLFEANPDGTPCVTEDGSLVNAGQVRLARATTDGDQTSATAEVLGLGGQEGDPGEITLLGASADCNGQDAWILSVSDGTGEVLRIGDGGDVEVPDLAMDDDNGIFFTQAEGGKAQAVAVRIDGTELVVIGEAEAHCA
jgi:protocatechuate 3,4-dioxygenase beta subunit